MTISASCALALDHGGVRDILRRLGAADDEPVVLLRKKAFRDREIKIDGRRKRRRHDSKDGEPMAERPAQPGSIKAERALEPSLKRGGDISLGMIAGRSQKPAAHHRRQGERHHPRHQDRDAHGDRELAEQPADQPAHQQQRDEDCDERQGHRKDGEADLARAVSGRPPVGPSPASICRMTFSTMTTPSSMMKPTAMVSAISDTLSTV